MTITSLIKKYRENGIPYAACGLIWKRFGKEVIGKREQDLSAEDAEKVFHQMDHWLIEGIDATDNGVKTSVTIVPSMNVSSIIAEFNPPWDSEAADNDAFNDAVDFASRVLGNMLEQKISAVKAKSRVTEAYKCDKKSHNILPKGYPIHSG